MNIATHFAINKTCRPNENWTKKNESDPKNILPPEQKGTSLLHFSSQSAFRSIKRLRDETDDNGVTETDSCYYQPQLKQPRLLPTTETTTNFKDSITNSNLSILLNCIPATNTVATETSKLSIVTEVTASSPATTIIVATGVNETVLQQSKIFEPEPMFAETFNVMSSLENANVNVVS